MDRAEQDGRDPQSDGVGPEGAPTVRLRHAITALRGNTGSREELRAAARALVTELRQADEPPEQMLLAIKTILADAGLRGSHATPVGSDPLYGSDATIYRDVITWSIREYYERDGHA